jgi:hypothetical protein
MRAKRTLQRPSCRDALRFVKALLMDSLQHKVAPCSDRTHSRCRSILGSRTLGFCIWAPMFRFRAPHGIPTARAYFPHWEIKASPRPLFGTPTKLVTSAPIPATNIIAHGFYLEAKFFALIAWASPDGAHRSYDGIQLFSLKAPHHATQSPHRSKNVILHIICGRCAELGKIF